MLVLTISLSGAHAQAQLRIPNLHLPLPQRIGSLDNDFIRTPQRLLDDTRIGELTGLRGKLVDNLLRQHRQALEPDPRGAPAIRGEILAWSPSPAGLQAAAAAGLRVLRAHRIDGLDETIVVLGVPDSAGTAAMLERLRALDPDGSYDFNHVYQGGGTAEAVPAAAAPAARDGLIDSGVDAGHAVFAGTKITPWGCAGAAYPSAHGSAVAALMVGRAPVFAGAAPGASLFAADVYCGSPTGGAAEVIAAALGWMAQQQVAVVNLSIVGPPNRTLERAVAAMVRRGHLLVAAVGNDGPAAPPLYPASYPGVVGVSAVDRRGKVLPEAARGPQVMFAAPGNDMVSAAPGEPPYRRVRGTSFAAPIVAALLANRITLPDPEAARGVLAELARQASGAVDGETGRGIVGRAFRVDPATLRRASD